MRLPTTSLVVLAALVTLATVATTPAAGRSTRAMSATALSQCGWPIESTPTKANVAYPDSNATYWTMPFVYQEGLRITISGTYPVARFFSFNVYASNAQDFTYNGTASALTDFNIAPDAGSSNPWVANPTLAGRGYTVSIAQTAPDGAANWIPIAPATPTTPLVSSLPKNTGFLMIRVYLPQGNDAGTVPLPPITFTYASGKTRTIQPCSTTQKAPNQKVKGATKAIKAIAKAVLGPQPSPTPNPGNVCTSSLVFCKAGGATTPFPNSDSGYVAATYQPAAGYVTVLRATMPTSASAYGNAPGPWPGTNMDLRYWSVCNYVYAKPFPVVKVGPIMGCVADQAVTLSSAGVATIVISSVRERPAQTLGKNATLAWLPTSPTNTVAKEVLAIRNMLAAPGFASSVMNAQNTNQPSAESVMGVYYPTAVQCTTATFALGGADGCFAKPATPSS